jgi:hypothetical protein
MTDPQKSPTRMSMRPPAPRLDEEPKRLGMTAEFAAELRSLAEQAPSRALTGELLRLAEGDKEK